jgi:pilus assembly protein Flp/PilA
MWRTATWSKCVWRHRTERGASLVEYALLVSLIGIVCLVAVSFVGGQTSLKFSRVGSRLQ